MFKLSLKNKPDDELMQLLAEGNTHALTELYQRYSAKLLRYFFRMLWKDEAMAQDFLQDLFLKIITNPQHYQPGRKFPTWLFSVAYNMCKNEYRKHAFRKTVNTADLQDVLSPSLRPSSDEDEFRNLLDKALRTLDEADRNLYSLRYEVELPLEEISALLDCPSGTVKSRLFYLKKKLARHLKDEEPEKIKYGIQ